MIDLLTTDSFTDALRPLLLLFALLSFVSVLVCAVLIAHAVRSWRVQSATLQMQKDIADIKEQLRVQATPVTKTQSPTPAHTYTDIA